MQNSEYQLKISRKLFHVSSAWVGFVYIFSSMTQATTLLIAAVATALLLLLDFTRSRSTSFYNFFHKRLASLFIERDNHGLNSATWFSLSILIILFLFGGDDFNSRLIVGLPIIYLAFGDTVASVMGKTFGKKKMLFFNGSIIGFISCFITVFILSLLFGHFLDGFYLNIGQLLIISFIGAVGEGFPFTPDDNLSLTLFTATALYFMI